MFMNLAALLQRSASRHSHLCPRQVLGVRMGLAGIAALRITAPVTKATGLVIVETDGCFVDGIEVSTGATVGHRTLRVNDFGKIAATFVQVSTGQAVRISPQRTARACARGTPAGASDRYLSQLAGLSGHARRGTFPLPAGVARSNSRRVAWQARSPRGVQPLR